MRRLSTLLSKYDKMDQRALSVHVTHNSSIWNCRKDCVIVRTPYLSHGSQCDGESCTDRAASLNANPRSVVVHREAHELALSTAYQQILDSGKPKIPTDGYRSLHYKIRFPEELSDKVFGKKGVLDLNTVGWQTTKGVNELLFDISWNASLLVDEEDPRYDKRPKANETDYLADAIQGMSAGMGQMKL